MGGYLTAIEKEIDLRATLADKTFGSLGSANRQPLETLYLGGGTPSLLPTDRLASLVERIRDRFGLAPDAAVERFKWLAIRRAETAEGFVGELRAQINLLLNGVQITAHA